MNYAMKILKRNLKKKEDNNKEKREVLSLFSDFECSGISNFLLKIINNKFRA